MDTVVSFAVQSHPTRSVQASALASLIGGEPVWDPDPTGVPGAWRTFRHLLDTTPAGATHRLQIQDDAVVCPGFADAVRAAVAARPDRLLLFFVGRNHRRYTEAVMESCRADRTWARLSGAGWTPVVCTCWPVELAASLTAYVDEQRWPRGFLADDEIVGRWMTASREPALASVPSLVEHRDLSPSLLGRRGGHGTRCAACWIGDCGECVAGLDWTLGAT